MIRVVACLETMWDWRGMTSGAGYQKEAPAFFRINEHNFSGKRLYKLIGPDAQLLVTNACRYLVNSPKEHGVGDPEWLDANLRRIAGMQQIDTLLICGKVAQSTYRQVSFLTDAFILEMPHPAARSFWTNETIAMMAKKIQERV